MKFFSKWLVFGVTVLTIAWLTSIAFATGAGKLQEPTFAPGTAVPIHMAPYLKSFKPARPENGQAAAAAAATAKPQMSETVFKNIQVLKSIPVDEFMGTMGVFTTSLSLCCGNCHTGAGTSNPKWEDDPPRKKTARAMITMVQNINKTSFGGRQVVTCWTCHRGQTSPSVTPPLDFAYGEAVVNPPDILARDQNATKTVDQIFAKFIQAEGGQAKLDALTSYVGKGKSLLFGEVGAGNSAE